MPTIKPIIRKKGRYPNDGRSRYVIEWIADNGKKCSKALPKPEDLLIMMDTLKKLNLMREEEDTY